MSEAVYWVGGVQTEDPVGNCRESLAGEGLGVHSDAPDT